MSEWKYVECPVCGRCQGPGEDTLARTKRERDQYLANLTAVQTRCTELLDEVRGLRALVAGYEGGDPTTGSRMWRCELELSKARVSNAELIESFNKLASKHEAAMSKARLEQEELRGRVVREVLESIGKGKLCT